MLASKDLQMAREGNLIEISKGNLILKYKSYNRELVNKVKGDNV